MNTLQKLTIFNMIFIAIGVYLYCTGQWPAAAFVWTVTTGHILLPMYWCGVGPFFRILVGKKL